MRTSRVHRSCVQNFGSLGLLVDSERIFEVFADFQCLYGKTDCDGHYGPRLQKCTACKIRHVHQVSEFLFQSGGHRYSTNISLFAAADFRLQNGS